MRPPLLAGWPSPPTWLLLGALSALLGTGLGAAWPQNLRLWDALNRGLPAAPDTQVLLVGVGDDALKEFGPVGSWSPALLATALDTLARGGARAVGLDPPLSEVLLEGWPHLRGALPSGPDAPTLVVATSPDRLNAPAGENELQTGLGGISAGTGGVVRFFRTAEADPQGTPQPTFAWQLARAGGAQRPRDTRERLLRTLAPHPGQPSVLPFGALVRPAGDGAGGDASPTGLDPSSAFPALPSVGAAAQGRVVVLGLTSSGPETRRAPDPLGVPHPEAEWQARAVSSLLAPELRTLPAALIAALGALVAVLGAWAREERGVGLAVLVLALSVPLWLANTLWPGVTLSLCALLGSTTVALARAWRRSRTRLRDPLTGLGNRRAFTAALRSRWPGRRARPLSVALVDVSGARALGERSGAPARDAALHLVAAQLQDFRRRGDQVFRLSLSEFALLLDTPSSERLPSLTARLQESLDRLSIGGAPLETSVGAAQSSEDTPTPEDLLEEASRSRYRLKYQRDQRR